MDSLKDECDSVWIHSKAIELHKDGLRFVFVS